MSAETPEEPVDDRRIGERRKTLRPIAFADRRKGDRRSGEDRRKSPRFS